MSKVTLSHTDSVTLLSFSSSPCRSLDPSSSYISPQKSYALSASNFASRTLTFYLYVFWDRIAMFLALEANTKGRGKHFNKACDATVFRPFIAVLKNGLPFPDCLNSYPCGFYARKVLIQCPIMSILWTWPYHPHPHPRVIRKFFTYSINLNYAPVPPVSKDAVLSCFALDQSSWLKSSVLWMEVLRRFPK